MPPSPAFGWLCVVHTIADIAFRAAQIRSAQVLPRSPSQNSLATASENRSYGGPSRPQSAEIGDRPPLEPLLSLHVTGGLDTPPGIFDSEVSAVHRESSPQQLKVITRYQDNTLSPKLSGATERNVSTLAFLLNPSLTV